MELVMSFIVLFLFIWALIKFIPRITGTTKKAAYDTLTDKGRNRKKLVNELYQFIQENGGFEQVYINKTSLTIRNHSKYAGSSFDFQQHGYGELKFYSLNKRFLNDDSLSISQNSGGQITYDLANKLGGHVVADGYTVTDRGGTLADDISAAMGNYGSGTSGDMFVIKGAWIMNDGCYAIFEAQQKSQKPPKLKPL